MRVAVQCQSALLQRSLELFLGEHLSSLKQCDIVLRDKKVMDSHPTIYIANDDEADLKKPFSKSALYLMLEKFYKKFEGIESVQAFVEEEEKIKPSLEEVIDQLTLEYKTKVLQACKEYYE